MKNVRTAEIIIAASIAAAAILFLILGVMGGFTSGGASSWINYYGHTLTGSLSEFLYIVILCICLLVIVLVVWSLAGIFLEIFFPKLRGIKRVLGGKTPLDIFLIAAKRSREMLLIIPAVLFITIIALMMGDANMFAPARLQDLRVIGWEHAIFGNYIFAALGAIHYPHWVIAFIIFSFENMALLLIGIAILLVYVSRERFRELLVAFCIGIFAMVPLWLILPVLSPQDRFIDNVYQLPIPPTLDRVVSNYHPQPEIADFLMKMRIGKAGLPALPTSTIPSAHIFWAVLGGYYLFQLRSRGRRWKIVGWIALPLLLASSFGTILLAQHYFTDVPAGLAVAVLAIWLAHEIEKEEPFIDRL